MEKLELKHKLLTILQFNDFEVADIRTLLNRFDKIEKITTIDEAIQTASNILNVPVSKMKSRCRKRRTVRARAFIYHYFRVIKFQYYSQEYLGAIFGRDHATVINGLKIISNDLNQNFEGTNDDFQRFLTILEDTKTEQNEH